jgi:hypothetical protein
VEPGDLSKSWNVKKRSGHGRSVCGGWRHAAARAASSKTACGGWTFLRKSRDGCWTAWRRPAY